MLLIYSLFAVITWIINWRLHNSISLRGQAGPDEVNTTLLFGATPTVHKLFSIQSFTSSLQIYITETWLTQEVCALFFRFLCSAKLWQRGIMWKGEQRKVHLYQMFMKSISLVQVSLWNTNSLKHKIPNTSPLKLISWVNIIPWHKSMIHYSWTYQSYISYCASLVEISQVDGMNSEKTHTLVHLNFLP